MIKRCEKFESVYIKCDLFGKFYIIKEIRRVNFVYILFKYK